MEMMQIRLRRTQMEWKMKILHRGIQKKERGSKQEKERVTSGGIR